MAGQPQGKIASVRTHFDGLAPMYDRETSWRLDGILLDAIREVFPDRTGLALELGCGTGILGGLVRNAPVIGLDLSPVMCARSIERGLRPVCGDLVMPPLRSGHFDLIVMRQVFQYFHLPSYPLLARNITRLAAPGGCLILHHFTVEGGAGARSWWKKVKKHLQPLRKSIMSSGDFDAVFLPRGWSLDVRSHQRHRRTFSMEEGFRGSSEFPTLEALERWIIATAEKSVPDNKVHLRDGILMYDQVWSLARYSFGARK